MALTDEEITQVRTMLSEWLGEKQREAEGTVQSIDRAIAQPIQEVDPVARKREQLATEEGQLKALLPYLPDAEQREAREAIARSEGKRRQLVGDREAERKQLRR